MGLERSAFEEKNDAKIAKDVADSLGVRHIYFHTDAAEESIDLLVDRFLMCVEGRSDLFPRIWMG